MTTPTTVADASPTPVSYALSTCADYECVFAQSATPPTAMGWRWEWPGANREIQAYSEVMFGDSSFEV